MEIWKTVKGHSKYEISNYGRLRGGKNPDYIHKGAKDKDGYILVLMKCDEKGKYARNRLSRRLHRVVAEHFIPNPYELPQINHKDGNKENNHIDNLEWITVQDNILHCHATGLHDEANIMNSKRVAKVDPLTNEIIKIYPSGKATKEDGYFPNNVRSCCRGDYGRKFHKGFKWKFVD
jgi:hypothetical protein